MKHKFITPDEIVNALQIIHDVCENADEDQGCQGCPIGYNNGGCKLADTIPAELEINTPPAEVWRAIK